MNQKPRISVSEDLRPRDIMSCEPGHWKVFGQLLMALQCCAEAAAAVPQHSTAQPWAIGQRQSSALARMTLCLVASHFQIQRSMVSSWNSFLKTYLSSWSLICLIGISIWSSILVNTSGFRLPLLSISFFTIWQILGVVESGLCFRSKKTIWFQ